MWEEGVKNRNSLIAFFPNVPLSNWDDFIQYIPEIDRGDVVVESTGAEGPSVVLRYCIGYEDTSV